MKNKKLLFNLMAVFAGLCILAIGTGSILWNNQPEIRSVEYEQLSASYEYLNALRVNQNTGTINPADVLLASEQSRQPGLKNQGINWISGGPDNFAGRTRAIIFDNKDNTYNTLYAGSVSGGLWKSTTGGVLWDKVPNTGHITNISCMVQDSNGKIYIGTGETFQVFRYAALPGFMGNGMFVSTNGVDFEVLQSTKPVMGDTISDWAYINRIAVHPTNPNHIYAATHTGLWFSGNAGVSWQIARDTNNVVLSGVCTDVRIGSDGITIASLNNLAFISNNGAPEAFFQASKGGTTSLPLTGVGRIDFAIAPTNPNFIYGVAATWTPSVGQLQNIYQSRDRGQTWRVVGPGGSSLFNVFGSDNVGVYACAIIVHPTNPEVIYVGGKNLWRGTKVQEVGFFGWENMTGSAPAGFLNSNHHIYAFRPNNPNTVFIGTDRGIFRSVTNLTSFQNMNKNYMTEQCYSVSFNSGRRIFSGTQSNGILFISEAGNTNKHAERIDNTPSNGGHVAMSLIHQKALIWTKAVPSSSTAQPIPIFRSDDLGATVALAPFVPVSTTLSNFLPPMLFWESFNYTQSYDSIRFVANDTIAADSTIWVRSANGNYPFRYTVPQTLYEGDTIMIKDTIATRLFYGTRLTSTVNAVFMTKHAIQFTRPAEWYRILQPLAPPHSFGISRDANYLWVGTNNGHVYRLGNLHNAYDTLTAVVGKPGYAIDVKLVNQYTGRIVTSIAVDPQNPDHVIVTLGNYGNQHYVYRSVNATSADPVFESIQFNLPLMPVYSALIEMNHPELIILGTENGIWTIDLSSTSPTWSNGSGYMGEVPVFQIKQQLLNQPQVTVPAGEGNFETFAGVDNYGKIYVATFGRGIFKTEHFVGVTERPVLPIASGKPVLNIYPNPANNVVFIDHYFNSTSLAEVKVFNLNGQVQQIKNLGVIDAGRQAVQIDISNLNTGVYLITLTDGDKVFSNKLIVR